MPLQFIYLNSPPVVAVNCDNRKGMGKEKWTKQSLKNPQKMVAQSLEKKNMTKWKSNFKSINSLNVSS